MHATREPLAGVVRRLLIEAGHRAAQTAGYGNTVRSGFRIAALMSETLPPSPDPETILVSYRPRYDEAVTDAVHERLHAEYAAVLNAFGLNAKASAWEVIVRRRA